MTSNNAPSNPTPFQPLSLMRLKPLKRIALAGPSDGIPLDRIFAAVDELRKRGWKPTADGRDIERIVRGT